MTDRLIRPAPVFAALAALLSCLLAGVAAAATPPGLVNYQGILRDASDRPLSGAYDMSFAFYSADAGGDQILVDDHLAGGTGAVTASNGLFNVSLGGGIARDGSGPGKYTSLSNVFRDYGDVWMEITVGGEALSPRVKIQSSAYALNASNLNGKAASSFLDTSSMAQTRSGALTCNAPGSTEFGVTGFGIGGGGYFRGFDSRT